MKSDARIRSADWRPFDDRGRSFLRATLPDGSDVGAVFTIAQTIAGRYEVADVLAVGEASVLLLGRDLRTRQDVVIKAQRSDVLQLPPDVPDRRDVLTAEVRRRRHLLQTERRLLVRLRNARCDGIPHPNDYVYDRNPALEAIFGAGPGSPRDEFLFETEPHLILEAVAGVSLQELLDAEYPRGMGEDRALRLIVPVIETLRVLHEPWRQKGGRTWHCVYQDLKPSNILVDPAGRPRLLDFGGCQVVVDGVPVLEGACTLGFSAPECEGPPRVLLPCADVYSIGATLYKMLTGIDPHRQFMQARSRGRTATAPHLDFEALADRSSPPLRRIIERCLASRPSDRYADARRVAEALAPLVAP